MEFPNEFNMKEFNKFLANYNEEHAENAAQRGKVTTNVRMPVLAVAKRVWRMEISATAEDWLKIMQVLKDAEDRENKQWIAGTSGASAGSI